MTKHFAPLAAALALCGCAMDNADAAQAALAGDDALLALVNDQADTDFERLDVDCAIRSDSARQIIRHRDGRDRTAFTADDDLFDTVEELDDVPMVGPWTLDRLRECADRFGYGVAPGEWTLSLDTAESGASQAAVAALEDGTAAVFHRGIDFDPSGNTVVSRLRTFDGASWSAPIRLDEGLPSYASSYGTEVDSVFDHHLVALDDGRLVAGVGGRYSSAVMNAEGQLYTVFLRVRDASGWGAWHRVTPVGRVFNAALDADSTGRVWIAYDSAYNLAAGSVQLTWFDPSTGAVGTPEVIDASPASSAFQKLDVTVIGGDVWVTYWGVGGLYARARRADGSLGAPLRVSDHGAHSAAASDGTLWIAATASGPRTTVFRLAGDAVVEDAVVFEDLVRETDEELESTNYAYPAIAARPEGGVVVGVARIYHFERWVDPISDEDRTDLVVRERTSSGAWTSELAIADRGWDNPGGAMASTSQSVWAAGASWDGVFAASRTVAP